MEALRRIHALAPGFDAYWEDEVVPFLSSGHRPPVLAGFASFAATERFRLAAAAHLDHMLARTRADAYDSHPTLAERIAAVAGLPAGTTGPVAAGDGADRRRRRARAGRAPVDGREPGPSPSWCRRGGRTPPISSGSRRAVTSSPAIATRSAPRRSPTSAILRPTRRTPGQPLSAALALTLRQAGWSATALPGDPVSLIRGDERVVPVGVVAALAAAS